MAVKFGMQRMLDDSRKVYTELRKRGVRAVIGGDYGFAQTPQGTNARDLKHFVDLLGYSPGEALQCGTRLGGELMGMGDELGMVKEGFVADLLLVNGDPLKDLDMMVHEENLVVIMKDGELYKDQSTSVARRESSLTQMSSPRSRSMSTRKAASGAPTACPWSICRGISW